ncbi:MAG: sulfite oxidase-like oxidoreductase [Candidatus Methanofastidiosia archaeon]
MNRMIESPDTKRENRIPPGQRVTEKWPVLQYGDVHDMNVEKWSFTISGLVEQERTLGIKEFISLPRVTVFSDIHCVTGWSRLNNVWEGVSTSVIKDLVTIRPEAQYVMVHAEKQFTTNLRLDDFFVEDVLFAVKHDGRELTPEHGYPVRLVVPRLYFWKSAKWVTGVEFMAEDKRGFWESHGYHNRGDPWMEERYS